MREININEERAKIAYNAGLIFFNSQRRLAFVDEDIKSLDCVSKNLTELEEKLKNTDKDDLQNLFGGEFSIFYRKDEQNGVDELIDMNLGSQEIPLFLILDFAKIFLESQYIRNPRVTEKIKEKAKELIPNIERLRQQFAQLKYSDIFDSDKKISDDVIETMQEDNDSINSGVEYIQDYSFGIQRKFGKAYITLDKDISTASVIYKNGEEYTEDPNNTNNRMFIFEEDKKEVNKKIEEEFDSKLNERKNLIYPTIKKYFGIDNIDECNLNELDYKIEDSNLDSRLKDQLKRLIFEKKEIDRHYMFHREENFLFSYTVENIINKIKNLEKVIGEEEKAKNHRKSIEDARKRYREKSFLWKLLNRKLNPINLNLESMEDSELDELYVERRK